VPNREAVGGLSNIGALADLLRQPYALDPGALEYLVEESLNTAKDAPVQIAALFFKQALRAERELVPLERENLGRFIRRAAAIPTVRRAFEKSLRPMGRCPTRERIWVRQLLVPIPVPAAEAEPAEQVSGGVETLDLTKIAGAVTELHLLIDAIGKISPRLRFLNIRLGEFTYASGLAVIAQWILAHSLVGHYEFVDCPEPMARYLDNIRFSAALRNPSIVISPDPMDWAIGLTRINRDEPTEQVTEKIVDILHTFANPTPEDKGALLVLISEMIENIHRHADAPVDGFAVAQVYPRLLKMGITLVDAGMGVRASFESGEPSIPIGHLRHDSDFLREAVKLHSTSKKQRHSGYGLFLLSEVIARNRGTFALTSGSATLVGYQKRKRIEFDVFTHSPWRGTIVSVIIDLHGPLPLSEVYREMPIDPELEADDLFT